MDNPSEHDLNDLFKQDKQKLSEIQSQQDVL